MMTPNRKRKTKNMNQEGKKMVMMENMTPMDTQKKIDLVNLTPLSPVTRSASRSTPRSTLMAATILMLFMGSSLSSSPLSIITATASASATTTTTRPETDTTFPRTTIRRSNNKKRWDEKEMTTSSPLSSSSSTILTTSTTPPVAATEQRVRGSFPVGSSADPAFKQQPNDQRDENKEHINFDSSSTSSSTTKIRRSLQDEETTTTVPTPLPTTEVPQPTTNSSSCSATVPLSQKYLLVEFLGYPRQLASAPSNIDVLENEFVVSYNIWTAEINCISMNNVTILQDAVDNYADSDPSDFFVDTSVQVGDDFPFDETSQPPFVIPDDEPPQAFSVLMVTDGFCTGCKDGANSYFFSAEGTGAEEQQQQQDESNDTTTDPTGESITVSNTNEEGNQKNNNLRRSLQQVNNITLFDPCSCRGPTVEDVVRQYAVQLSVTEPGRQYITAVIDIVELTSPSPECLQEAQDLRTNFQTTVIVTVDLSDDSDGSVGDDSVIPVLTNDQVGQIENLFLESYHACNLLTSDSCDPVRRRISIVSATTDIDLEDASITTLQDYDDPETSSSYVTLLLTVDVVCVDCTSGPDETVLFDRVGSERVEDQNRQLMEKGFRRSLQQLDESVPAFVLDCLCPLDGNIPIRSCTIDEFFDEYSSAMAGLTFPVSLVAVQEVRLTESCPTGVTEEFTEVIILDLDLSRSCGSNNENNTTGAVNTIPSEEDFDRIEEAIVAVYNNLASFYCDPFFRFLRNANVTRQGNPLVVPSTIDVNETLLLPVEVTVTGSCQNGCDPDLISIYDIPALSFLTNGGRKLASMSSLDDNIFMDYLMMDRKSERRLQEIENCYCAANPVGDRAPSEPEFVVALDSYLTDEATDGDPTFSSSSCVVSGVGDCAFGELFESTILLTVNLENNTLSNEEDVQEFQSLLETSVLASLKQFYEISDQRCPLDSRIILSVEAILDVIVFTPPLRDSESFLFGWDGRTRMLQTDSDFNETVDDSNSTEGSEFPTESPTLFTEVTGQDEFDVALIVTGLCDGCESNALLVDDVSNRRLRKEDLDISTPNRFLQEMNDPVSLCFCPLGAEPVDEKPTFEEFQSSVQTQLEDNGSSAQITDTKETDECEIDGNVSICPSGELSFECSTESTFTTTVVVDLQYICPEVPDPDTLDFSELQQIADEYVAAYNQLQGDYCDTQVKTLTSVRPIGVGELLNSELPIEFEVAGICRNCNLGENVGLYEFPAPGAGAADSRRLDPQKQHPLSMKSRYDSRRRRTQNTDGLCFCDADALADTGFDEAEFISSFTSTIEGLQLACFQSVGSCSFGTPWETSFLARLAPGTEVNTEQISLSVQDALNNQFASSQDACSTFNSQTLNVAVFESYSIDGVTVDNGQVVENRRLGVVSDRDLQAATESAAPSFSPTVSLSPTLNDNSNGTVILLTATGVCDGCTEGFILADDVVGRRRGETATEVGHRILADECGTNCYCCLDAVPTPPVGSTQQLIEDTGIPIEEVSVVKSSECSKEEDWVGLVASARFNALAEFTSADLSAFADTLSEAYNNVAPGVCDLVFQPAGGFNSGSLAVGCQEYIVDFVVVSGTCQCVEGTTGLFAGGGRRRIKQSLSETYLFGSPTIPNLFYTGRKLQEDTPCQCSSVSQEGSPSRSAWDAEVNALVSGSGINGIGCTCAFNPLLPSFQSTFTIFVTNNDPSITLSAGDVSGIVTSATESLCADLTARCQTFCNGISVVSARSVRNLQDAAQVAQRQTFELTVSVETQNNNGVGQRQTDGLNCLETANQQTCQPSSETKCGCTGGAQTTPVPSPVPTIAPITDVPTEVPTDVPTDIPTDLPTIAPTTLQPSVAPSDILPSESPSKSPTSSPSSSPSKSPTSSPSSSPTPSPSSSPSKSPSPAPSAAPSKPPTSSPSSAPSPSPTVSPSKSPTQFPTTDAPSFSPTDPPPADCETNTSCPPDFECRTEACANGSLDGGECGPQEYECCVGGGDFCILCEIGSDCMGPDVCTENSIDCESTDGAGSDFPVCVSGLFGEFQCCSAGGAEPCALCFLGGSGPSSNFCEAPASDSPTIAPTTLCSQITCSEIPFSPPGFEECQPSSGCTECDFRCCAGGVCADCFTEGGPGPLCDDLPPTVGPTIAPTLPPTAEPTLPPTSAPTTLCSQIDCSTVPNVPPGFTECAPPILGGEFQCCEPPPGVSCVDECAFDSGSPSCPG